MMRQYELVERVAAYNPQVDEELLNRAYVYAMQKHGAQMRASGELYFSPSQWVSEGFLWSVAGAGGIVRGVSNSRSTS